MKNKNVGYDAHIAQQNKSVGQGLAPAVKKIASLLLAIVMLFSITAGIDLSACAATSGKCGKNATWSYNEKTSTLTISGKGAMTNYKGKNSCPWEKSFDDEFGNVKVNIENGITSIGSYSFTGYYYDLKNFKIPNSVKTIEYNAFCNFYHYYVYEDFWRNGLVYISNCLVDTNQDLPSNLVIKEGTRVIKKNMFNSCRFKSVKIPKSLSSIPDRCFTYCSNLSSVTFNGKVQTIGEAAFYGTGFKKFVVPNGVTQIGECAFGYCESLTSLTIPKTVTKIGEAFIQESAVKNIYYKGTKSDWNKIKIGKGNSELKNIKITYSKTCKAHKYKTTITKATTSKNGSVVTKCTVCGNKKSSTTIYYPKTINLSATSYTYDGKAKKPSMTVKDSKGKKISASNYTVTYSSGRKNVGKYTVTIKFKGNYSGTVKKTFTIKPKATTLSSVSSNSVGTLTIKWKKQATQTTGYQIQYSTDKNFKSNNKTVTVSKNSTVSKKITGLTGDKRYYVRVRTYKTVSGTKYCSSWSSVKNAITASTPDTITLSSTSYTYDGEVKKPSVTVKNKGKTIDSKYYTVSYSSGRKNVGKYTVTIKFKTPYMGSVKKTFTIKPKATSINSIAGGIQHFSIEWKKQTEQTTGYEIQYSTDENFNKDSYIISYTSNNTIFDMVYNLDVNKKYYVRIRTYKTINGTEIYSSWSKSKSVTTLAKKNIEYTDSMFSRKGDSGVSLDLALASIVLSEKAYSIAKIRSALYDMGYKADVTSQYYDEDKETKKDNDHSAYVIAHKKINGQSVYAVVIRGTEGNEWISNGNVGNLDITAHEGFNKAMCELETDLSKAILKNNDSYSNIKIWITGHSRGAAIANLLAASLLNEKTVKSENMYCYTFACPNVSINTKRYDCIFNFINQSDFVPTMPLVIWGFKRNGIDISFNESTSTLTNDNTKLNFDNIRETYKQQKGKEYDGLPLDTNNEILLSLETKAPTYGMYYNGYEQICPRQWFEDLMSYMADKSESNKQELIKSAALNNLLDLTLKLYANEERLNNTHDSKAYYAWVKEYARVAKNSQ